MIDHPDKSWEYYGKTDPYYGVITQKDYHRKNLSEDLKKIFFESGKNHIDQVLHTISTNVDPMFKPKRALDFGCGVGRLIIPLASKCDFVVGIDVSESMLHEARKNCLLRNTTNVEFIKSDDSLSKVSGTFDFIHSYNVFQHIPHKRGEKVFTRLIELLQEGGIGVLHFTYFRSGPAIRLIDSMRKYVPLFNGMINIALLKLPFRYPLVQMNEYDLRNLFCILQEKGCHHCYVNFSSFSFADMVSTNGIVIFFQKKSLPLYQ